MQGIIKTFAFLLPQGTTSAKDFAHIINRNFDNVRARLEAAQIEKTGLVFHKDRTSLNFTYKGFKVFYSSRSEGWTVVGLWKSGSLEAILPFLDQLLNTGWVASETGSIRRA